MTPFTENVVTIIRSIPEGKVMTYGQIARLAGSPRAARQVVRNTHTLRRFEPEHPDQWQNACARFEKIAAPSK